MGNKIKILLNINFNQIEQLKDPKTTGFEWIDYASLFLKTNGDNVSTLPRLIESL